jgi:hypothetical protein
MYRIRSLYRGFLEKKLDSSWNSGFFWGAIASGLAVTYTHNRREEKYRHTIPKHTGDDCLYCREYSRPQKTSILQ